jgi:hypothetical protein
MDVPGSDACVAVPSTNGDSDMNILEDLPNAVMPLELCLNEAFTPKENGDWNEVATARRDPLRRIRKFILSLVGCIGNFSLCS